MKRRVADIILDVLVENGITDCFAVVGGGAMHINNALALRADINKVFCHHEQACAMAAEGYAKACGRIALVSVTSGPGALNTLNGVEGAWVDNTPMIIISGHPRYDTTVPPTGLNLRCRGVQEFDIITAVQGMTKYAHLVIDPLEIRREIQKALDIAVSGRRGPVWLSIPLDVQSAIVDTDELYSCEEIRKVETKISEEIWRELNKLIITAERPCILSGSAIRLSGGTELFREWTKQMNVPVVGGALLGDILYHGAANYYGGSGNVGPRKGNFILQNADLIIVIGNSLATKQTGFNQSKFAPHAKIVMVDIEPDEMKKPGLNVQLEILADAKEFIQIAMNKLKPWKVNKEWIAYCDKLDDILGDIDQPVIQDMKERVPLNLLAHKCLEKAKNDAIFALGNSTGIVGFLQQGVRYPAQRMIVNYNSGSMGDDLPEAIGVAVAMKQEVICVTGDGSIMMNLQELQTIQYNHLPIKIIIISNNGYGAIRQTNKNFFDGVYIGCDESSGINFPDFSKIAAAFEYQYFNCPDCESLDDILEIFYEADKNTILEIQQKLDDPVLPKVMSKMQEDGKFVTPALHDMYPFLDNEILEKLNLYN